MEMDIPITVAVKTVTGKTIRVEMALNNTIADLKKKIQNVQHHGTSEDLELKFDEGDEEVKADTTLIGDILGHRIFDILELLLGEASATQFYKRERSRSRCERSRSRDRK